MKKIIGLKGIAAITMGAVLFFASCEDDKIDFSSTDSSNVENEASTDGYFEDADDISAVVVWSDDATSGGRAGAGARKITIADLRCSCANVTIEPASGSDSSNPTGVITVDFGTGCTDAKGNVRKGKIIINYSGRRYAVGATREITFDQYFINGVQIEGLRNVINISGSTDDAPKFSIEVIGGKATWSDGTFATREVRKTREWQRASNPLNDTWTVSQSAGSDFAASGTNRNGKTYQMNITTPLIYKRECAVSSKVFMAVQGEKELITDSKKVTINYGTGDCDKTVTITVNGKSEEVNVKGGI